MQATASVLDAATGRVRDALARAGDKVAAEGMPRLDPRGQVIRPLVAYAVAERLGEEPLSDQFWRGALAVQMVHEASLVHDDIVDGSPVRRGKPTLAASRGVGAALVLGDHLLTAAYRVALGTGSAGFGEMFALSVERTVAGEIAQARSLGRALDLDGYRAVAAGKSGELLGCAMALAPALAGRPDAGCYFALGRRFGLLYQMLDDLLDYCPGTDTGKPPLGDYAQRRWTWPLFELEDARFGEPPERVAARLRVNDGRGVPLHRCLARLEAEAAAVSGEVEQVLGGSELLGALVSRWMERARAAVEAELRPPSSGLRASARLRERVPAEAEVDAYLAVHSRSFHFAARLFPPAERGRVGRVYAFCRVTDDLVDRPGEGGAAESESLLEEWLHAARRAYQGAPSGIPFLDRTMREMAEGGVDFACAHELAEGMRMDLRGERYASLFELRRYTYRVASVVGLWLSGLAGIRDPRVLERAAALGHAMQLTNILRDVGEDLDAGRLYLPADRMAAHGLDEDALHQMRAGGITRPFRDLVEELIAVAEADYRLAFAAIPELPPSYQRPVAVAAHVYRGIHDAIRRNGYDTLRLRARTSPAVKLRLASRALWDLRSARRDLGLVGDEEVAQLSTPTLSARGR